MMKRIPLAWLNLIHDRRRFATSLAGVGFAVLLMFMFNGFMNALYDSQLQLLNRFNGEVIVVNRLRTNMFVPRAFARRRLYQARAFDGVQDAYAVYISEVNWKNPETRESRVVRVIAINPDEPVLNIPELATHRQSLKLPATALMDTQSRAEVGPIEAGVTTELADRQIRLVGTFTMGTDFASGNGNLLMSDQNFLRYFADRGPEEVERSFATVDVGVIKLEPGANVNRIVSTLQENLPNDVLVLARDGENGFVIRERKYWQENTNIGFVFSLLTSMGFFVGIILVYQILYTDVADHESQTHFLHPELRP
ncbi:MAG: DevC protein, partial [Cyanobacteria bacterium J06642_11]